MKSYPSVCRTIGIILTTSLCAMARTQGEEYFLVKQPEYIVQEIRGHDAPEAAALIRHALEAIEEADISPAEKGERIARTVGCAIHALDDRAPEVFGLLGPQIRLERLSLVTASAVLSSGAHSSQLVNAMFDGADSDAQRAVIVQAASGPTHYLTRAEMRECRACATGIHPLPVRPEPIRPLPDDPDRVRETDSPSPTPAPPAPSPPYNGQ